MTLEQKNDICLRYIAARDAVRLNEIRDEAINALHSEATHSRNTTTDDAIDDLLKELGVPSNIWGHRYLHHAIRLCKEEPTYIDQITKRLYPTVAKANNTTPNRAERAIRHSIESAFLHGDPEAQYKVFGNTIAATGRPTNSAFITACAQEVKRRMRGAR